ncbi:hypothetical protein PMAC_000809 [Pneumocystis sp. 'macacae']|nr:hypothetical protein PMAC_000809 [Pneumocystis sp. 'macacae']
MLARRVSSRQTKTNIRIVDPVARQNVESPGIRDRPLGDIELVGNRGSSRRHKRCYTGRDEVNKIDHIANNVCTVLGTVVEEGVVEMVRLEKGVAAGGKIEDKLQRVPNLYSIHVFYVASKNLVDVLVQLEKRQGIRRPRQVRKTRGTGQTRVADQAVARATHMLDIGRHMTLILGVDKLEDAVDKVAEVGKELRVVPLDKLGPGKHRVRDLRTRHQEIVSPHRRRHIRLLHIVPKNTNAPRLGKLPALILKIL